MNLDIIVVAKDQAYFANGVALAPLALQNTLSTFKFNLTKIFDVFVRKSGTEQFTRFSLVAAWGYKFPYLALLSKLGELYGQTLVLNKDGAIRLDLSNGEWIVCRPNRIAHYSLAKLTRSSRGRIATLQYLCKWKSISQHTEFVYAVSTIDFPIKYSTWQKYFPPENILASSVVEKESLKTYLALYVNSPSLRPVLFEKLLEYSYETLKPAVYKVIEDLDQIESSLKDVLQILVFQESPLFD